MADASLFDDVMIARLEAIARDPDTKPSTAVRALEELGRWRRSQGVDVAGDSPGEELAPDPMADMTEWEQARQRRSRRAS